MDEAEVTDETIELMLDESNELSFRVKVAGTESKPSAFRLVCEDTLYSYCFNGQVLDDETVQFLIPSMTEKVRSGVLYSCAIEVLVENRFFRPVTFSLKFKENVRVVAESVKVKQKSSVGVFVERKAEAVQRVSASSTPSFVIKPIKIAPPKTLQEKLDIKRRGSIAGLDDKAMEEVARSVMSRLIAKDFDDKDRK